jgi:hypothetical protein
MNLPILNLLVSNLLVLNLLTEAMNGLGAALLQVVALLAIEELTFGGLVRLMMAPRPGAGRRGAGGAGSRPGRGRGEHKNRNGERQCSR